MISMGERIFLPDESATAALASDLARTVIAPALIALWGDLGAGKTVFARAFIRAFTGLPALEVPSPTFTLVQTYDGPGGVLRHFDLYRLDNAHDAEELGLHEALADGIALIEWPERLGALLPAKRIDVRLTLARDDKGREARIEGANGWNVAR